MRAIWFMVGMTALGLGALGVVLPLLPTTPFLLLAAFAFARSSERWHRWLVNHQVFGPMIENWHRHGAISRRAKIFGTLTMIGVFCLSLALHVGPLVLGIQGIVLLGAASFVLSRPLPPSDLES